MVLLFDVGGVLVDLDLDLTLAGFDQIGIDLRPYLDSARQAGFLSDYESGKINTETMLSKMRALSTKSDLTDDEIAAPSKSAPAAPAANVPRACTTPRRSRRR